MPTILKGDRHELVEAGPARARLIDDSSRTASDERELRVVFNHQDRTVSLSMVVRDGANLQTDSLAVFTSMIERIRLDGDIAMSDPMDPVLAASNEIGEAPFLSEADAGYVAVSESGMTMAEVSELRLVSEQEARQAVDGACRDFEGSPPGVWLVTVGGILPGGQEAERLVYLDAESGIRLCQADAPGVS